MGISQCQGMGWKHKREMLQVCGRGAHMEGSSKVIWRLFQMNRLMMPYLNYPMTGVWVVTVGHGMEHITIFTSHIILPPVPTDGCGLMEANGTIICGGSSNLKP